MAFSGRIGESLDEEGSMAKKVGITAVNSSTIQITLPDGLSVRAGQTVPLEVLDMVVAFARLQSQEAGGPGEPEGSWCVGGCGAQH
jgi:hypothetical protein